jgi:hypothetical protein
MNIISSRHLTVSAALLAGLSHIASHSAQAAIVNGDPLETALEAHQDSLKFKENHYDFLASDQFSYDSNIYRLNPGVTDLSSLSGIGSGAKRQDYLDTLTAGFDGMWNPGRQTIAVELRANANRYGSNQDLNNVSNRDKVRWSWGVGDVLTGQVGAIYDSGLIGFVNSTFYGRDIYSVISYFGTARYQLGPRWSFFGGVLDSRTTLSDVALRANDSHAKSVDFGTELATSQKDSIGLEYRYTDATYPIGAVPSNNFREDAGRIVIKHAFSEKTDVDGNVGFLKRTYSSDTIPHFSGDVWRVDAHWQPTDKLLFQVGAWRNLQAYLSAQSDYYVDRGERISPQWTVSEKIAITAAFAFENQDYIGIGLGESVHGVRRDTLTSSQAAIKYTPFTFLVFDFGYTYEKRTSNDARFQYNDNVISAEVTVKL